MCLALRFNPDDREQPVPHTLADAPVDNNHQAKKVHLTEQILMASLVFLLSDPRLEACRQAAWMLNEKILSVV